MTEHNDVKPLTKSARLQAEFETLDDCLNWADKTVLALTQQAMTVVEYSVYNIGDETLLYRATVNGVTDFGND